jgi:hypothetical protein
MDQILPKANDQNAQSIMVTALDRQEDHSKDIS